MVKPGVGEGETNMLRVGHKNRGGDTLLKLDVLIAFPLHSRFTFCA